MSQNEKYDAIVVGICHDAALLAEMWKMVQDIFTDYVDEVIKTLAPIAEALSNPFSIEEPTLSAEEIDRLISSVDNEQQASAPPKKYDARPHRPPQRTHIHYNYIPRAVRNQPYQRRAY